MTGSTRYERFGDWLWFLVCGVVSSIWCLTAAGRLGATFDEPIYLSRGLEHWRTGSYHPLLQLGTMPLPVDVETLPLYLWERWRGVPFDSVTDFERLLPVARAMALVFWWLLLGYGRLAGRALAGPWGGRLAVAWLACEPSFLAHAGLATTDISVTACLLALVYHFRVGRESGWFFRRGVPAIWFAAALLAKASALVYGPLCLLAVEMERVVRAGAFSGWAEEGWRERWRRLGERWRPFVGDLRWVLGGGLAGMLLYCGSDWQRQPAFVEWAEGLPPGGARQSMVWLSEHLRIFTNGGEGLVKQVRHNIRGHGAYLLGRTADRALWWYFPALLAIKLTVPLLLAPWLVLLVRPRALCNWALAAAAFVMLLSPLFRVQIGIRLVLPIVAMGVVGLAAALVETCNYAPRWRRTVLAGACGVGMVWMAATAATVWPHGLCYVNPLWGGTANGYRLVSEANYDWGQGLKELARWQQRHQMPTLDIWYFGSDPLLSRLPLRLMPLHSLPIRGPEDVRACTRGHYLAVSTTMLYGTERASATESQRRAAAFLREQTPAARTTTFFIYDFTRP